MIDYGAQLREGVKYKPRPGERARFRAAGVDVVEVTLGERSAVHYWMVDPTSGDHCVTAEEDQDMVIYLFCLVRYLGWHFSTMQDDNICPPE